MLLPPVRLLPVLAILALVGCKGSPLDSKPPDEPGLPSAPTSVRALASDGEATVTWTAPPNAAESGITGYRITAEPGGLTVEVEGAATTSALFTGLTNDTPYTFTVVALSARGASSASAPTSPVTPTAADVPPPTPTAPGAPTAVVATRGVNSAGVSWTAPSNGGSAITGYQVTSSPGGVTVSTTGATSVNVPGLTAGTAYTFTVTATNAIGTSPASQPSNIVTPTSFATQPGAPRNFVATPGDRKITLTWDPPSSDGGAAITNYYIRMPFNGYTYQYNTNSAATTYVVTPLTNGTSYNFEIFADNPAGRSVGSASVTGRPSTIPSKPSPPSTTPGDSKVTVQVSATDGGSPITSWSVTRQPGNVTMTQATGPFEFTGLTNGTSYTFTAVATNANGAGPVSDASQPIIPAGAPGAPTNVVATAGDTEVTVTWTAPASTGGVPLTGYTVTASPGGAVKVTPSTSVKYTRLPNGMTYTFSVVANNAVSSSPAATSNPATPTMVVCSGTPIFGAQPLIPAGGNVQFLLARDFDADGKVDIVASLTSKKFAFLKGLGGGRFGAPTLYDATDGLLYLEAVDFNGDGKLDLASHSTLWPGNGDGTFQTDYSFRLPSLTGGTGVAFGDFNGDGKLDSVSVNNNYGPEQIYIGLGNGAGVFTKAYSTRAHPTSNVYPISVVAADFNGDGKLDVATANNTFYDSNVSVLFGNGDGTLGAPAFVQVNGFQSTDLYSQQVIAADYDKDGDIDLIVASPNQGGGTPSADGRVSVLINPGNGVFARSTGTSTGPGTSTVAFEDFDGNGTKELVSAAYTDGTIALQPRGLEQQRFPAGAVRAVAAADVDGDGKLDLLGGGADGIAILRGRGDGTFLAPVQYATGPWPQGVTVGQMDGDGYPDVIVFDQDKQSTTNLLVSVMRNDPAQGNFYRSTVNIFYPAPGNAYLHNDYPRGGAFGDFNGDGTTDLVLYTRSDTSGWNFEKFFYSAAGQPGAYRPLSEGRTLYQQYSSSPYGLVTGNFDGLGNVDLLATQSGTFAFINSGAGTGSYFYGTETNVGSTGPVIAADVNGDGRQDVIAPLTSANTVSVHLMGGTGSTPNGTLGAATTYPAGTTPYEVVAGDFNGDGKMDLVTMNSGSIASFLAGDGLGAFAAPVSFASGGSSGMAAGDFDQDGDLDLAFANATTSSIALVRGNGAGSFSAPILYPAGKNPMGLRAADVNRDGRLDLITVANQASGSMRVFQNNGCVAP